MWVCGGAVGEGKEDFGSVWPDVHLIDVDHGSLQNGWIKCTSLGKMGRAFEICTAVDILHVHCILGGYRACRETWTTAIRKGLPCSGNRKMTWMVGPNLSCG